MRNINRSIQKLALIVGVLLSVTGLFGMVANASKNFAHVFVAGFLIVAILFLYKLARAIKGKEKWGMF